MTLLNRVKMFNSDKTPADIGDLKLVVEFLDPEDAHLPRDTRRVTSVEVIPYDAYLKLPLDRMANCRITNRTPEGY